MAADEPKPELLAIVGPTASGKSELALRLAKEYRGEIIAADSRTIFKDLDIGTAKATRAQRKQVPHFGLDLVEPGQRYTAADFKRYAEEKIDEIKRRNHLPVLAGGTGLYIDSVLYDFNFGPQADHKKRSELERLTIEDLQKIIKQAGHEMPRNALNKRHLIRTIEREGYTPKRDSRPCYNALVIGLLPPNDILRSRINRRADDMFKRGVIKETARLREKYPQASPENMGLIYKVCTNVLDGQLDELGAREMYKNMEWQYARRQRAWFKRNPDIRWFDTPESAKSYVDNVLNT